TSERERLKPSTHSPPSHLQHRHAVSSVAPSAPWRRLVRRAFRYLAQSAPSRRQLRPALSSVAPSATSQRSVEALKKLKPEVLRALRESNRFPHFQKGYDPRKDPDSR
ncbi:hypothetical protein HN51_016044, partial [Arachis hypogaea]